MRTYIKSYWLAPEFKMRSMPTIPCKLLFSNILTKTFLCFLTTLFAISCTSREKAILVFSKTSGFRHGSIEAGISALQKIGIENDLKVTITEDARYFVEDSLQQYATVLFLNTTGDILNDVQQADFERYIQAGGGFVGVHAAADTEYDWPWYNKLVGAVFDGHPKVQEATLQIADYDHLSTTSLDSTWIKSDEWYNFRSINPDINILIKIDEDSYEGGTNGENHPISWFHEYDGGRAFYTEMGHTDDTFKNPKFLAHLKGGIQYAMGNGTGL